MKLPTRTSIQLCELLRFLRKRRHLTQDQLGYFLGVDRRRISQIECNPGVISFNQLSDLITILGGQLIIQYETADDDGPIGLRSASKK